MTKKPPETVQYSISIFNTVSTSITIISNLNSTFQTADAHILFSQRRDKIPPGLKSNCSANCYGSANGIGNGSANGSVASTRSLRPPTKLALGRKSCNTPWPCCPKFFESTSAQVKNTRSFNCHLLILLILLIIYWFLFKNGLKILFFTGYRNGLSANCHMANTIKVRSSLVKLLDCMLKTGM